MTSTAAGAETLKTKVLHYVRANADVPVEGAGVQTMTLAEVFGLTPDQAVAVVDELVYDLEVIREPGVPDPAGAKVFPV